MAKKNKTVKEGFNEILLYTTVNGKVKVEIFLQNETIWLTQQKIAELFGVDRTVVTKHLENILKQKNLTKTQLVQKMHILPPTVIKNQSIKLSIKHPLLLNFLLENRPSINSENPINKIPKPVSIPCYLCPRLSIFAATNFFYV